MFIPNLLSAGSGDLTSVRARIAVVEDEPDLREAVAEYLGANGYSVAMAADAAEMRALIASQDFELAILDIAMPGEDGLSLGRWLRSKARIGLIFATAAGTPIDKIVGLELGADDYVTKPYELRELLARVRSVLRRLPKEGQTPDAPAAKPAALSAKRLLAFGPYKVDLDGRLVTGPAGPIELPKSEFDVLEVFLVRPNRVLTRSVILDAVGHQTDGEATRALDLRIMRLRRKIEDDPANPRYLRTVRGEGYMFDLPASTTRDIPPSSNQMPGPG
jgi:DNA-binding response OmpR family regulator